MEVWLRGALPGVPALLQPVGHALLQANEEIQELMKDFPGELLWERPAGVASVAFHLQHIPGVLDRLLTYSNGQPLSAGQLHSLQAESVYDGSITKDGLVDSLNKKITEVLKQLEKMDEATLTEARTVGRQMLPSTKLGLIFHAAEHTMRHTGQLHVTVKVLLNTEKK
ncbi:MAG TPA: DinB family protein [Flavitalea sp.]|nr:DinB family protein [Flavitalea sp.]